MTREREIEAYLVEQVKALGGEVRKVQWVGRNGAPDRVVFLPPLIALEGEHRPRPAIWVELKAPGEKPRPSQLREHARMRAMGQRVEVVESFEGVERVLEGTAC